MFDTVHPDEATRHAVESAQEGLPSSSSDALRPSPTPAPDSAWSELLAFPQEVRTPMSSDQETCSVCGKLRPRELLHNKAIQGRLVLVCAPSCLGAQRRIDGR